MMPSEFELEALDGAERARKMKRDVNDLSAQVGLQRPPTWPGSSIRLGVGSYGSRALEGTTKVFGLGAGSVVDTITARGVSAHISGVELSHIDVRSGKVVIQNCTFKRHGTHPKSLEFGVLASGAQLVFVGCTFYDGITSSYVVDNQATLNDLIFVGCINLTGLTLASALTNYGTV